MRELLLRPSLTDTPATVGLYSFQWILLPAFFLGPLPVIVYSAFNSYRLKRRLDGVTYLLATACFAGLLHWVTIRPEPEAVRLFAEVTGSNSPMYTLTRIYALMLWAVFYLMHRPQHRAGSMLGDLPSPWRACLLACVLGIAVTWALGEAIDYVRFTSGSV